MKKEVTVFNKTGIHVRAAALFSQAASKFKADILVEKDGKQVNAKNIMGVLALGITPGTKISIITKGMEEQEAMATIMELLEGKFGEE